MLVRLFVFASLLLSQNLNAETLETWLGSEEKIAIIQMSKNISPEGTRKGVIIASPPHQDPDYYFHWVRDSALVMNSLFQISGLVDPAWVAQTFQDYASFSQILQNTPTLTGLGEPRFNVDGSAYNGPWSRPQNDGPALRILTLLSGPSSSIVKAIIHTDLGYLLSHSQDSSFDLWEELRGDHFYTRIVQLAAITKVLGHPELYDQTQAANIESVILLLQNELDSHWLQEKKYMRATLNRIEGAEAYKHTDLDSAVILGVLHASLDSEKFSVRDDRILSTATALEEAFQAAYEINNTQISAAPAIGRYTDDVYFGGNPWCITTFAFAELNYRLSHSLQNNSRYLVTDLNQKFLNEALSAIPADSEALILGINLSEKPLLLAKIVNGLKARGDLYMQRIRLNTPVGGELSEQFNRKNGAQLSAKNLTWSYASFLTAVQAR